MCRSKIFLIAIMLGLALTGCETKTGEPANVEEQQKPIVPQGFNVKYITTTSPTGNYEEFTVLEDKVNHHTCYYLNSDPNSARCVDNSK